MLIETADEFRNTLIEVDLLLDEAANAAPGQVGANEKKFAVMNKSALLLLTGKFEAFLEGVAEDFLFEINEIKAKARHIPARLLLEHSVAAVKQVESKLLSGDLESTSQIFVALGRRWTDLEVCSDLVVTCRFSYGKHGEKEMIRLFRRLGIEDVFALVTVEDESVETYEDGIAPSLDVAGIVNSLTGIRNNILHQDETPNLTTDSLRKQNAALQRFGYALVQALQRTLDDVKNKVQVEHLTGNGLA